MKYPIISLAIFIALVALIITAKTCRHEEEDPRIRQLAADTTKKGKEIAILKLETKSLYARAIKAEQELYKPKAERKELKKELAENKTIKDSINTLVKLDSNAETIINKQDTVINTLEKVKLFQDSTINHLEAKVKDVKQLDEIHLAELKKEKRKNFWHKIGNIALPAIAFILGVLITK